MTPWSIYTEVEQMESKAIPPKDPTLSETTENYLKRIKILIDSKGKARISDIARLMGRTLSSVSEAVKRMSDEGYLHYEKYGKITLTDRGEEVAQSVHNNYKVLNDLLQTLGIPEHIAIEDACSMEHQISDTTINTISEFVKYITQNPELRHGLKDFINYNPTEMPSPMEFDDDDEIEV